MKIPVDDQTRLYELTYLLPASLTKSELETAQDKINQLVEKHQGKVVASEDWGKRQLAYRIKQGPKLREEAIYTYQVIEFSPEEVKAFREALQLNEQVMRFLLVLSDQQEAAQIKETANSK